MRGESPALFPTAGRAIHLLILVSGAAAAAEPHDALLGYGGGKRQVCESFGINEVPLHFRTLLSRKFYSFDLGKPS